MPRFAGAHRGSTVQRGYNARHVALRKQLIASHHPANPCCLCGHPLGPAGPWLHLDHCPTCKGQGCQACRGAGYRGLAHGNHPCPVCRKRCNSVDGARRGNARARTTSLTW